MRKLLCFFFGHLLASPFKPKDNLCFRCGVLRP